MSNLNTNCPKSLSHTRCSYRHLSPFRFLFIASNVPLPNLFPQPLLSLWNYPPSWSSLSPFASEPSPPSPLALSLSITFLTSTPILMKPIHPRSSQPYRHFRPTSYPSWPDPHPNHPGQTLVNFQQLVAQNVDIFNQLNYLSEQFVFFVSLYSIKSHFNGLFLIVPSRLLLFVMPKGEIMFG